MARDRKRARQRRERPARKGQNRPAPQVPAHVPGPVEHASGDVDEIDAAIARGSVGALGVPGTAADVPPDRESDEQVATADEQADGAGVYPDELNGAVGGEASVAALEEDEAQDTVADSTKLPAQRGSAGAARRDGAETGRRQSLAARTVAFLRASVAELQRMQWPDRRQTSQATAVVLGFVVVAAIYLGVADWVAQRIVNFIL